MTLRVEGNATDASVWDGRRQITGPTDIALAERQLAKIVRARASTRRTCLCCGRPFTSTGFGNRLCGPCRSFEKGAMI